MEEYSAKEVAGGLMMTLFVNTLALVALKLTNQIDMDWLYVFIPIWFNISMFVMFILVVVAGICVVIVIYGILALIALLLHLLGVTKSRLCKFGDIFKYRSKSRKATDNAGSDGGIDGET